MTFIVYVDDPAILDEARERSTALCEKHCARLVLVDATEDKDLSPGERKSRAHAQVVPGVPTVLFWAGRESVRDPNFIPLNELADSLVLDSSRGSGDLSALRELIAFFAQSKRFKVQDLAYLRLRPWKEMIATFFDDPKFAGDLGGIEKVMITAGSPAEQYYLLGWLASRLGWKPGAVETELRSHGKPRRIYEVALSSKSSTYRAVLQNENDLVVCLTVEGANAREQHCETLRDLSIIALVERAILAPQTTDVYRATIEAIGAILAHPA